MLSYLVTSKARRALLQLLWKDKASGSVQELARAADVSYAAAHTELSAMQKCGLALSRGEGKTVVFWANEEHPNAGALRQLFDEPAMPAVPGAHDDAEVLANLKRFGAPLQTETQSRAQLSLEETLARALVLSHRNATVLRTLPLVVCKHAASIDLEALRLRANELRQSRSLGFVLDVAASLSHNPGLKKVAASLQDKRVKHTENYFSFVTGRFALEQAQRNTPALARKWRFVVNMPMESFQGLYDKFAEAS